MKRAESEASLSPVLDDYPGVEVPKRPWLLSRLFFLFVSPIISYGFRHTLQPGDLYKPDSLETAALHDAFERAWQKQIARKDKQQQQEKQQEKQEQQEKDGGGGDAKQEKTKAKKKKKPSNAPDIRVAVLANSKGGLIVTGFLYAASMACQLVGPMMLQRIVTGLGCWASGAATCPTNAHLY
jgi:hypothetical protein